MERDRRLKTFTNLSLSSLDRLAAPSWVTQSRHRDQSPSSKPDALAVELFSYLGHAEPRMIEQKFPRLKFGSLRARTSALTLPNVVSGFFLMPSAK